MQFFYPYLFGGGEYIFFLITKELAKRGHNIHIIAQMLEGTQAVELFEGIKINRVGLPVIPSELPPKIRYHLGYMIHSLRKGREIITENRRRGENIDIIHSNVYVPALSGQLCSRFYGIPHIVTFHVVYQAHGKNFWKDSISKQKNVPFYASALARFIEKTILRMNISGFHAVTEITKKDLISCGASSDKITVIPNGIDITQYHYKSDTIPNSADVSQDAIAVYVGRLQAYKNIQVLIEAFKDIIKVIPKAQLVIVGDGPDKTNLVKQAESLKNNITFTGRITHDEKVKIIKNSSFVVFPSIAEGFPMTIIEGFACKRPVLVSDVRPLSDIVKDGWTGLLIPPPFDAHLWTEKMMYLFNNMNKQEQMGRNAYQELLSNYDIGKIASRIEKFYEDVMRNSNV
jgi:glycosyltransferase involved in cell wall biosynthesis